ncbi:MAG: hypothetical protein HYZ33_04190 [Ignavibacteriales bacterium]|nr:hypothetical protein [Ignavibacteriales bacterium]
MKTKKPRVTKNPIEFRLLVTLHYDEIQKKQLLLIGLQTIKEFTNFQYDIVVDDALDGSRLTLNILGLRAPKGTLPRIGTAQFTKMYEKPSTIKNIVVRKMDKKENSFVVSVTKLKIRVKEQPLKAFVEIVTNRQV